MIPSQRITFFWLLLTVALLFTVVPFWITEGMFMDGLFYSTIARNIAVGSCEWWQPKITDTFFSTFYDHPPLGFIIQSVMYISGYESVYLDKLYCCLVAVVQSIILLQIWQLAGQKKEDFWLPLLLYFATGVVFWGYGNNALEITMSLFTSMAVYLQYKASLSSSRNSAFPLLLLAGIFITGGFWVKGPVALFPLAFFPVNFFINRSDGFMQNLLFFGITFTALVVSFILVLAYPPAADYMSNYFNIQLMASVSGNREIAESRFLILDRLWQELLVCILPLLTFMILHFIKTKIIFKASKSVLLFVLIGISASLPLLISPKQMGFYLIPSFAMFAIGFSLWVLPLIHLYAHSFVSWHIPNLLLMLALTAAIYYNVSVAGTIGRDHNKMYAIKQMLPLLEKNSTISADESLMSDYSLLGSLYRYNYVSMDHKPPLKQFIISPKNKNNYEGYSKVMIDSDVYDLFAIKY